MRGLISIAIRELLFQKYVPSGYNACNMGRTAHKIGVGEVRQFK